MNRVKRLLIGLCFWGISMALGGCGRMYTKEDMERYAEERLEEKYGEEFEVCDFGNINGSVFEVYAYPKNNPDIIFEASYNVKVKGVNEYEYDHYIEELIATQYKKIAEESMEGFGYEYYIDIGLGRQDREVPLTNTSITIPEYNEITEKRFAIPSCEIYMTYDVLNEGDEYIYNYLCSIRNNMICYVSVYVVETTDFQKIIEDYATKSKTQGEVSRLLTYKYSNIGNGERKGYFNFAWPDTWETSYEDFEEIMKEVREDAKL